MNLVRTFLPGGIVALPGGSASAADLAGQWRAKSDTQIGVQKYLFTFETDGNQLTGKAASGVNDQKREAELKEGMVTSNTVSFVGLFGFQGNELRIRYAGKVSASEISFTREVGEFAKEEFK